MVCTICWAFSAFLFLPLTVFQIASIVCAVFFFRPSAALAPEMAATPLAFHENGHNSLDPVFYAICVAINKWPIDAATECK